MISQTLGLGTACQKSNSKNYAEVLKLSFRHVKFMSLAFCSVFYFLRLVKNVYVTVKTYNQLLCIIPETFRYYVYNN